jgi:GNAT superfamily N-acetyltransferase
VNFGKEKQGPDKISITELTKPFAAQLREDPYFTGSDVLEIGLIKNVLTAVGLHPRVTRLVACNNKRTHAIGFLCLKETNRQNYTIEKIFVHPNYRKRGIASLLLKQAMFIAKEKGAKKVNLSVYTDNINAIRLYRNLGFKQVGQKVLGQGFLSDRAPLRVMKRLIKGQGALTKLALDKRDRLFELKTNSNRNNELLYKVIKESMSRDWLDFFEIKSSNPITSARHTWQPKFYKHILINDQKNFFALIYHLPFSSKATIEVYSTSNEITPLMLNILLKKISNMGISFIQILCFDRSALDWFEDKGKMALDSMMIFDFCTMGRKI